MQVCIKAPVEESHLPKSNASISNIQKTFVQSSVSRKVDSKLLLVFKEINLTFLSQLIAPKLPLFMSQYTSKKEHLGLPGEKPSPHGSKGGISSIKHLKSHRSEGGLRNLQRAEVQQRIQEQQSHQLRKKMQEKANQIEKELNEANKQYAQCLQSQRLANANYRKAQDRYFQDLKGNHQHKQLYSQQLSRLNNLWQQECKKMNRYSDRMNELKKQLKETESLIVPPSLHQKPKTEKELARDRQIQEAERELQQAQIASQQAGIDYHEFERKFIDTDDKEQFKKMSVTYKEKQRHYYKLQEEVRSIQLRIRKLYSQ